MESLEGLEVRNRLTGIRSMEFPGGGGAKKTRLVVPNDRASPRLCPERFLHNLARFVERSFAKRKNGRPEISTLDVVHSYSMGTFFLVNFEKATRVKIFNCLETSFFQLQRLQLDARKTF